MFFDRINYDFSTNLSNIPNLYGQKNFTHEICQIKFGRVKEALEL